jgi:hypothetical protein
VYPSDTKYIVRQLVSTRPRFHLRDWLHIGSAQDPTDGKEYALNSEMESKFIVGGDPEKLTCDLRKLYRPTE